MKIFSLLLLSGFACINAMDSLESLDLSHRIYMSDKLDDVRMVKFNNGNFKVKEEGHAFEKVIQKAFVDKQIRDFDQKKLIKYLKHDNYLVLDKMSDGEYTIKGKSRIRGGGPVAACIGYWAVKTSAYTLGLVGLGAGIAVSGGTIAAGGGALLASFGASAAVGTAAGVGAGAVGLGVASAGAAGAAAGAALAEGTAAVVASAGGIAGAMAAVETASCGVAAFLLALPIP